jgi:hypothetical protein
MTPGRAIRSRRRLSLRRHDALSRTISPARHRERIPSVSDAKPQGGTTNISPASSPPDFFHPIPLERLGSRTRRGVASRLGANMHARSQNDARCGIICLAAIKVRILPARHIEQPGRHAVQPCALQCQAKSLPHLHVGDTANRLCHAISGKSAEIPPATCAHFDPNGFRSSSPITPAM